MNTIDFSYLLGMGDVELTNWIIENQNDFVIVKKSDLSTAAFETIKRPAFEIGRRINEDQRINKSSKNFAIAIILNLLSEYHEEYDGGNLFFEVTGEGVDNK